MLNYILIIHIRIKFCDHMVAEVYESVKYTIFSFYACQNIMKYDQIDLIF